MNAQQGVGGEVWAPHTKGRGGKGREGREGREGRGGGHWWRRAECVLREERHACMQLHVCVFMSSDER